MRFDGGGLHLFEGSDYGLGNGERGLGVDGSAEQQAGEERKREFHGTVVKTHVSVLSLSIGLTQLNQSPSGGTLVQRLVSPLGGYFDEPTA